MTTQAASYDFGICKVCERHEGRPTYRLRRVTIYVCASCGFHYAGVLAPEQADHAVEPDALTEAHRSYIEDSLHSNVGRFESQIATVLRHARLQGARLLDAGCGAGLFMSMARSKGAETVGLDLSDARILYGRDRYGLDIRKASVEDAGWRVDNERFDIVTMWDVLEHVNFPVQFVSAAASILTEGGYVFIDTPRRESFLHRFGGWAYRITGGRWPAFLSGMYSDSPYGHKQILSAADVRTILERSHLELIALEPFKELSLPVEGYLRKFFRLDWAVSLIRPIAGFAWKIFPLKNKMLVVARKPAHRQ